MRKLTPRTAPVPAFPLPSASRRAGHRSGEGADSALAGLRDDAAQRPDKAPDPAELPTADPCTPAAAPLAARIPRTPGGSRVSRVRLARAPWTS